MENFGLSGVDFIIITVYLLGIVWYGIKKGKQDSSEDYFLGGRTMTWPIVGIALFSANISSSTLVGLASDAYQTNINVYNYEWFAVVVLIFFSIFFTCLHTSSTFLSVRSHFFSISCILLLYSFVWSLLALGVVSRWMRSFFFFAWLASNAFIGSTNS